RLTTGHRPGDHTLGTADARRPVSVLLPEAPDERRGRHARRRQRTRNGKPYASARRQGQPLTAAISRRIAAALPFRVRCLRRADEVRPAAPPSLGATHWRKYA